VTAIAAPQEEEEPAPKAKAKPATPVEDDTAPKSNMKAMESKLSALFADD
jgi:hypothetical protein